jgi:hypothetical protein
MESKLFYVFIKSTLIQSPSEKARFDDFVSSIKLKKTETLRINTKIQDWLNHNINDEISLKNLSHNFEKFKNHVTNNLELMNIVLNPDDKWLFEYDLKTQKYITVSFDINPVWKIYSNSNSPSSSGSSTNSNQISPQNKHHKNHRRVRSEEILKIHNGSKREFYSTESQQHTNHQLPCRIVRGFSGNDVTVPCIHPMSPTNNINTALKSPRIEKKYNEPSNRSSLPHQSSSNKFSDFFLKLFKKKPKIDLEGKKCATLKKSSSLSNLFVLSTSFKGINLTDD